MKPSGDWLSKIVESELGILKCFQGQHFRWRKQPHHEKQQKCIFILWFLSVSWQTHSKNNFCFESFVLPLTSSLSVSFLFVSWPLPENLGDWL